MTAMQQQRKRSLVCRIRFPPGQYAVVVKQARQLGMPLSAFVRLAALTASGSAIADLDRLHIARLLGP